MSLTRRKFVSLFATVALALSMVVVAPASAFAEDATSGTINATATEITALTGDSVDLAQYFRALPDPSTADWHLDYVMSSTTASASVNKHSGAYVATTAGTSTVTVYLMAGAAPTGNPGKPCNGPAILDQKTITINVTSVNADYGYQGAGSNSIMVTNPAVTSTTSTAMGYLNTLSSPANIDGYYYITYVQNAGFKNYNTPAQYTTLNSGKISLSYNGGQFASLGNSNVLTVDSVDNATKTVVLKIDANQVTLGQCTLMFGSDLRGNNAASLLGSNVAFCF